MIENKKIISFVTFIGTLFLFVSLNPFFTWIIWPGFINFPVYLLVILSTLLILPKGWLSYSPNKLFFILPLFVFAIHIGTTILNGPEMSAGKLLGFFSVFCILLYKPFLQYLIFDKFRKLILFFCWVSIIVFILRLPGFELPYYKLSYQSLVMERSFSGSFYKLYGIVVSSTNTVHEVGRLTLMRVCGPFLEPGHFSIYIGLLILFENMLYNKISKGFIIAGFLTFSPNFVLFLGLTFLFNFFTGRNKSGVIKYVLVFSVFIVVILVLNPYLTGEIYYLIFGRNLEGVNLSIEDVLNDRAGKQALAYFEDFKHTPDFVYGKGLEFMSRYGVLSDWRGMALKYGLIGLIASVLASIRILFFGRSLGFTVILVVGIAMAIIFMQRSWMFESPFIYLFLITGIMSYKYKIKQRQTLNHEIKEQKEPQQVEVYG